MQAIGLIETKGLIPAIESADAMLKAADVNLLEKTHVGGGLVSIVVTGDVAAVKAAVEAGAAAVNIINHTLLVSQHVIPRPHEELNNIIGSAKTESEEVTAVEIIESGETVFELNEEDVVETEETIVELNEEDVVETKETIVELNEEDVVETEETIVELNEEDTVETEETVVELNEEDTVETEETIVKLNEEDTVETEETVVELNEENTVETEKTTADLQMDLNKLRNKDAVDKMVLEYGLEEAIEVLKKFKVIELRNLARQYKNFGIVGRKISKADKKLLLAEFKKYYGNN